MTATATATRKWTEADVKQALYLHFTAQGYAVLEEFSTDAADRPRTTGRRIDVLCIRPAKKRGIGPYEILAIEVKVTRSDFLQDVRRPEKQAPWRALAHRHAYATPAGLVSPDEVPAESGLLTVDGARPGWDKVKWARQIRFDEKAPVIPARFLTALAYRAAHAEALQHGRNQYGASGAVTDPAELRATVDRLTKERDQARDARATAESNTRAWRQYATTLTGHPCSTCGQMLKPTSLKRHEYGWRHVDKADDKPCAALRRDAAIAHARQEVREGRYYSHEARGITDIDTWVPENLYVEQPLPAPFRPDEEPPA